MVLDMWNTDLEMRTVWYIHSYHSLKMDMDMWHTDLDMRIVWNIHSYRALKWTWTCEIRTWTCEKWCIHSEIYEIYTYTTLWYEIGVWSRTSEVAVLLWPTLKTYNKITRGREVGDNNNLSICRLSMPICVCYVLCLWAASSFLCLFGTPKNYIFVHGTDSGTSI